jgi:hypothetical protein
MPRRRFDWQKAQMSPPSDLVIRSGLPGWVVRALRENGIKRMSVLSTLSDQQLSQVPGLGARSIALIREELKRMDAMKNPPPIDGRS